MHRTPECRCSSPESLANGCRNKVDTAGRASRLSCDRACFSVDDSISRVLHFLLREMLDMDELQKDLAVFITALEAAPSFEEAERLLRRLLPVCNSETQMWLCRFFARLCLRHDQPGSGASWYQQSVAAWLADHCRSPPDLELARDVFLALDNVLSGSLFQTANPLHVDLPDTAESDYTSFATVAVFACIRRHDYLSAELNARQFRAAAASPAEATRAQQLLQLALIFSALQPRSAVPKPTRN